MLIRCSLDVDSISKALRQVKEYQRRLEAWADRVCKRLGDLGYQVAYEILAEHIDTGSTVGSLSVVRVGEGQYVLMAESEALLFLEFGAGVIGYGHPTAGDFGMGPGTWSEGPEGKGHWDDPNGWWYYKDGRRRHSFGNPPYMPFYQAGQEMHDNILKIAREELTK